MADHDPVTMRDLDALEKLMMAELRAISTATELAADTLEKRLQSMNEFRAEIKDNTARMPTRIECETYRQSIESDLRPLRQFKAIMDSKASQNSVLFAIVIALISAAATLINLFR